MKIIRKIFIWVMAAVTLSTLASCEKDEEEQAIADLTDGYWLKEEAGHAPVLVKFGGSWQVFYYVCTPSGEDGHYDAYYDVAAQAHTRYALDVQNSRLCMLPDKWYDIVVLNGSALTLSSDTDTLKCTKVGEGDVNVLSREEYFDKHPEGLELSGNSVVSYEM